MDEDSITRIYHLPILLPTISIVSTGIISGILRPQIKGDGQPAGNDDYCLDGRIRGRYKTHPP
ncbi:MAG: hypothetical protein LBB43_01715 [Spirochaetaceae bacterium]|jgi:hypothetical protein|nr:hypothetical protein [Spirochaetaceae bacterium]